MSFEARCQQLDSFCQRLEGLAGQLSQTLEVLTQAKVVQRTEFVEEELLQAANALRSLPEAGDHLELALDPSLQSSTSAHAQKMTNIAAEELREESDSEASEEDDFDFSQEQGGEAERFGSLVADSYGKLR